MTKFLAGALGAKQPAFSQSIRQLERAAGEPSADIRLTEDIRCKTRAKLAELGLDPADTTPEELYSVLAERLRRDDGLVRNVFGLAEDATVADVAARIKEFFAAHKANKSTCFALRASVAKRMLLKKPPKAAMKRMGYRSVDSMLKHEPVAQIYAAAFMVESPGWHRAFREQYSKLQANDFEMRAITLASPTGKRWRQLGGDFVRNSHRNLLSFKELGTVVLLPSDDQVEGITVTMLLFVFEEFNAIRAHSSFIKLQQVRPDFGRVLHEACTGEAYVEAKLAGQSVSWRIIQRYFAEHPDAYHPEIFEPHVQPEDLTWLYAEDTLAHIHQALTFWQGTQALGLLAEDGLVSCNVRDVALGVCNHLPFAERAAHFARDHIRHELLLRYLNQDSLQQALRQQLSETLTVAAPELAFEQEI